MIFLYILYIFYFLYCILCIYIFYFFNSNSFLYYILYMFYKLFIYIYIWSLLFKGHLLWPDLDVDGWQQPRPSVARFAFPRSTALDCACGPGACREKFDFAEFFPVPRPGFQVTSTVFGNFGQRFGLFNYFDFWHPLTIFWHPLKPLPAWSVLRSAALHVS